MAQIWEAPAQPGPEVTHVRDRHGVIWLHNADETHWWGDTGHTGEDGSPYDDHRTWFELLARGPLTDATGEVT